MRRALHVISTHNSWARTHYMAPHNHGGGGGAGDTHLPERKNTGKKLANGTKRLPPSSHFNFLHIKC